MIMDPVPYSTSIDSRLRLDHVSLSLIMVAVVSYMSIAIWLAKDRAIDGIRGLKTRTFVTMVAGSLA